MIWICSRKVKLVTGRKSQTVNICTAENVNGRYDYIVRLSPPFITEDLLKNRNFETIKDIVS